jgi:hypothetical protein
VEGQPVFHWERSFLIFAYKFTFQPLKNTFFWTAFSIEGTRINLIMISIFLVYFFFVLTYFPSDGGKGRRMPDFIPPAGAYALSPVYLRNMFMFIVKVALFTAVE